jgi:membrane protease YdiL (CAAX protease family)
MSSTLSLPVWARAFVIAVLVSGALLLASPWLYATLSGPFAPALTQAALAALSLAALVLSGQKALHANAPRSLAIGFAAAAVLVGLSFAMGAFTGALVVTPAAALVVGPLALSLLAWTLHGFAEEAVFRGLVQRTFGAKFGALAGIALGAAGWAVFQALQGYVGPLEVTVSLVLGAGFGLLAHRFGLWAAVGAHAGWGFWELDVLKPFGLALGPLADSARTPEFLGVTAVAVILAAWRYSRLA